MIVEFHCDDADVASAHWAYMRRNPSRFIRYFRYPIVAIAVSAIIIAQYPESWQVAGSLLCFDAGTIAYEIFLSRRNLRKRFKNARFWQDLNSATIDGKSLRLKGRTSEYRRDWSEFSDVSESKRVFLFAGAKRGILLLPKSKMNESQIVELRILISTYAKGKVKLLSSPR